MISSLSRDKVYHYIYRPLMAMEEHLGRNLLGWIVVHLLAQALALVEKLYLVIFTMIQTE